MFKKLNIYVLFIFLTKQNAPKVKNVVIGPKNSCDLETIKEGLNGNVVYYMLGPYLIMQVNAFYMLVLNQYQERIGFVFLQQRNIILLFHHCEFASTRNYSYRQLHRPRLHFTGSFDFKL